MWIPCSYPNTSSTRKTGVRRQNRKVIQLRDLMTTWIAPGNASKILEVSACLTDYISTMFEEAPICFQRSQPKCEFWQPRLRSENWRSQAKPYLWLLEQNAENIPSQALATEAKCQKLAFARKMLFLATEAKCRKLAFARKMLFLATEAKCKNPMQNV